MSTTDVLVVGAGPVGMAMAMELSIQGVSFRFVEKELTRSDQSRAIGVHTRAMEVLSRYGSSDHHHHSMDELLSHSDRATSSAVWINRKQYVFLDYKSQQTSDDVPATAADDDSNKKKHLEAQRTKMPESQFEGPYYISQVDTEAFLERRLTERGVKIEYAVAAKSIVQDDDGVTVVLTKADGDVETLRCKYVVGCDGAHSIVRHAMNVKFEGDAYKQEFILADTKLDWDIDGAETTVQTMLGDGLVIIIPMGHGRARITASRPDHTSSEDAPTLKDFDDIIAKMIPGQDSFPKPRLYDPFWLASFHLHHRCATKYRDGRLFVAGDAAHIHSPVGGQGMNTGIQDSANLGWKLARVLQGRKPDAFLDSYHEERWPVGQHLLTQTDQVFSSLTNNNKVVHFLRNLALPFLAPWLSNHPERGNSMMRYLSQLGVKYRRSPIVRTAPGFEGPVRGGYRAPEGRILLADGESSWVLNLLRGPEHHLLLFSDGHDESAEVITHKFRESLQEDVHVHQLVSAADKQEGQALVDVDGELRKRYGFSPSRSGYVLVRPDGYVADIGYL